LMILLARNGQRSAALAQALDASFRLTEKNAAVVWQVCRKLNGIPLAIELASARLQILAITQIAARLNDSLNLLNSGSRTAPAHHQTMRATIDWSYDMLTVAGCVLLRRLSIFAGSFTFEAIEYICAPLPTSILDVHSHLVEKSLVMVERGRRSLLSSTGYNSRIRLGKAISRRGGDAVKGESPRLLSS
jgi:predicted ATPase